MTNYIENMNKVKPELSKPILISVCVCTYKRPNLYECLKSVVNQTLPEFFSIRIIVVDNCPDNSAAPYVEQFRNSVSLDVTYLSCHSKNLSSVRNTAIQAASGQFIAFVDDDEVVSKNWLKALVECSETYNADVVIGPVINHYSESCPQWLKSNDLMAKMSPKTGKLMHTGHTCNALVKTSTLNSTKVEFDDQFGRSGGEDTDFFYKLFRKGATIVSCREATVCEIIDPERENMEFLVQDNKRIGQVFCRVYWPAYSNSKKLIALFTVIAKAVIFGSFFIISSPFGKRLSSYWKLRSVCNIEKIRYLIHGNETIYRYCV